jgi:hypothetical protein
MRIDIFIGPRCRFRAYIREDFFHAIKHFVVRFHANTSAFTAATGAEGAVQPVSP